MKNLSKTILAVLATGLLSCGLFCQQAHAFSGSVFMTGTVKTSKVGTTNTVTFTNPWTVLAVPAPGGSYATTAGSSVTFTSFSYNTGTLAVTAPAAPFQLWTFTKGPNTYSFSLDTPLDAAFSTTNQLILAGHGTAYINGGDPSTAVWSLQSTGGGGFKFTATASTTALPDGGSAVALLGIALAGIEVVRRKIKAA
jgi:hypothetical protein